MRALITALAAGIACLAPLSASAQQPDAEDKGLWCVYESLATTFDYEAVAEAYIFEGDLTGDPGGVIAKAGAACATTHGLSESQKMAVEEYGRFGAVIDYLTEELMFEGATEDEIASIFTVTDALSDDDYDALYTDDWYDTEVGERVKAQLIAAKFPSDDYFIDTAMSIMGVLALADEAEFVYIMDEDSN